MSADGIFAIMAKSVIIATTAVLAANLGLTLYQKYEETHSKRTVLAKQARSRLSKLPGRSAAQMARIEAHSHNSHEMQVLEEVVLPNDISTSFAEVGGLKSLKKEIYGSIILPLRSPELWAQMHAANKLLSVPAGVLFYGPPGTGKTMMARAIAHSARATFINVRPSTWQTKWFGDSQQLVRAVFSVAQLYAPSIIFIDECDAFMKKRGGINDHEATNSMRSEFLSLWDGLLVNAQKQAEENSSVTVLCCTNRPGDLDDAFMRRMPRSFFFPLPDVKERESILRLLLKDTELSSDVTPALLAQMCVDYSGSDLKELCRKTAAIPLNAIIKQHTKGHFNEIMGNSSSSGSGKAAKRKSRKATLLEKDESKASAASSSAAAAASDAQRTPEASEPPSPVASSAAASSSAAAAPSVASSSDHATSLPLLALTKPRPLSLNDFRTSMRSIRPTSGASMRELLLFERKHRGTHAMTSADEDSEGEESALEASEQEDDGDELYQ